MGRVQWADLDINVRILRNFRKWIYAVHKGYMQRCSEHGNKYQGSITTHKFLD
jgi:hypothetical protein